MKIRSLRWLPLLALTLTVTVGSTSFAAGGKKAGARAERAAKADKTAQLLEQLNLTEDQKNQLKPVLEEVAAKRKALRADTTLTPEQKKEKMKENQTTLKEKLAAVLTPEQKQKLKELRKAQKAEKDKAAAPGKTA